jgi:hypothetical protein
MGADLTASFSCGFKGFFTKTVILLLSSDNPSANGGSSIVGTAQLVELRIGENHRFVRKNWEISERSQFLAMVMGCHGKTTC